MSEIDTIVLKLSDKPVGSKIQGDDFVATKLKENFYQLKFSTLTVEILKK